MLWNTFRDAEKLFIKCCLFQLLMESRMGNEPNNKRNFGFNCLFDTLGS